MAFSHLIEEIENGSGTFDPDKKYFIHNVSAEDFEITWAKEEPRAPGHGTYKIKSGEIGGPYNHFLAYHIVKHLVTREMQRDGKGKLLGSAQHRSPYEKKFLQEIEDGEAMETEDPVRAKIREEERAKLMSEMVGVDTANSTHAISEGGVTTSETRRKALEKESKKESKEKES